MIADPLSLQNCVVFYIWGFIYSSVLRVSNICEFLFPQELNLALASAARLNDLGDDRELMTHPGEWSYKQKLSCNVWPFFVSLQ